MLGSNQQISEEECANIRSLDDFDMAMLISEINDYGWIVAQKTLQMIIDAKKGGENG